MTKPDKIVDGLLVLHCQNGDKKAFSLLVKRWHIKMCKQAYWYCRDPEIAKDIAQDSWTVILKKIGSIREPNNFGSWALTIVNRKSLDWIRQHKKEQNKLQDYYKNPSKENVISGIDNEDAVNEINNSKIVLNGILKLPLKQQLILRLFYLEEISINEISKILELSKGTVKSRLFYARENLKQLLKNKEHEK